MSLFNVLSASFTLAVSIAYINHRYIRMQSSIAMTIGAMVLSLILMALHYRGIPYIEDYLIRPISQLDFYHLLMNGMLSFLLFAGALSIDFASLKNEKIEVGILASLGTVLSMLIVAGLSYYVLRWFAMPVDLSICCLFGALISPTDPIAVLAIFRRVNAPRQLDCRLAGESLFNDGVGVVLFLTAYASIFSGHKPSFHTTFILFIQQAVGGLGYGLLMGYLAYYLLKPLKDQTIEIFVTLALTTGGYALAEAAHVSGPLAMVVAGLFVGYRSYGMHLSRSTRQHLISFWTLIDEALNAILFLFVGLELMALDFTWRDLSLGSIAVVIVLIARALSVGLPMSFMQLFRCYHPYAKTIMIWGGLRGGLALALALSIPADLAARAVILKMTYAVVVFSIVVQGLTVKPLVKAVLTRKTS